MQAMQLLWFTVIITLIIVNVYIISYFICLLIATIVEMIIYYPARARAERGENYYNYKA